jgi:hypothetical protein
VTTSARWDKFRLERGATFDPLFTYKTTDGTPVNLAGCTARMQIRPEVDSTVVIADLTTENGGITLGGTAGTVQLFMSPTDTAAIDARYESACYDIEIVFSPTRVYRVLEGKLKITKEVTR